MIDGLSSSTASYSLLRSSVVQRSPSPISESNSAINGASNVSNIGQIEEVSPITGQKQSPVQAETAMNAQLSAQEDGPGPGELTEAEQKQVEELRTRDREVRAHEQAHKAAAGPYGGAIRYEYQTGPDGKSYAVGGSVSIDIAPVSGDPQATIRKMETVIRAANAPAEPSSQDANVAQQAEAIKHAAQAELQQQRTDDIKETLNIEEPDAQTQDFSVDKLKPDGLSIEA